MEGFRLHPRCVLTGCGGVLSGDLHTQEAPHWFLGGGGVVLSFREISKSETPCRVSFRKLSRGRAAAPPM